MGKPWKPRQTQYKQLSKYPQQIKEKCRSLGLSERHYRLRAVFLLGDKLDLVYHYADANAFLSIIRNKNIWLSGSRNMNDFMEVSWTRKILIEVINGKINKENNEVCQLLYDSYCANDFERYISCFSADGDCLSQWRSYASDGSGVSIGIRKEFFKRINHKVHLNTSRFLETTLNEVDYLYDKQKNKIVSLVDRVISAKSEGRDQNTEVTNVTFELKNLDIIFKNPAFHEEKEWRLIWCPEIYKSDDGSARVFSKHLEPKFRSSNGRVITYFEFDILPKSDNLSICKIILGPKNQSSLLDIKLLLSPNGFGNVKIERSDASYR